MVVKVQVHLLLPARMGVATARRLRTRVPFRDTWGCLAGARGKAP